MAIIPISLLWINLEAIMLFMGQYKQITAMAAIYCNYSLPDLAINTLLQHLRVYLRSKGTSDVVYFCARAVSCVLELFFRGGDEARSSRSCYGFSAD